MARTQRGLREGSAWTAKGRTASSSASAVAASVGDGARCIGAPPPWQAGEAHPARRSAGAMAVR
ncbi:MAG: hypothetical protein IPF99_24745 [Deltaproteobacteria bacterium]|nr:hypothetical protein [Deltaproteobacteria bacterium]